MNNIRGSILHEQTIDLLSSVFKEYDKTFIYQKIKRYIKLLANLKKYNETSEIIPPDELKKKKRKRKN